MSKHLEVHFSSETNEWATPVDFFNRLHEEFNFTLDPCASRENHKCDRYFTEADDGLSKQWSPHTVFMNPPYGRAIKDWVKKAYDESKLGATVVCLIPSRTDTQYWHKYCMKANEIRFIKGRLHFGNSNNSAPFPSAVVIFKPTRTSLRVKSM